MTYGRNTLLANQMNEVMEYEITVYGNSGVVIEDQVAFANPFRLEGGEFYLDTVDSAIESIRLSPSILFLSDSYARVAALGGISRIVVERKVQND